MRNSEALVLQTGEPKEFIESIPIPGGGSEDWLVWKFALRDRMGESFIGGVGVDLTERNRLEAELRQSQKLEAAGQLAGGVAHDFNNILAVIIGYSEAALDRIQPGDELAGNVQQIMKAANRGTTLIAQLLAFSRKQVLWPRVIDVNSALIDVDKILHRLITENIYLTLLLAPDTGCVKVDPGQVEQVVINLVVNARDAMPDGGELRVETESTSLDHSLAEQHGVEPGEYVVLQVSDTGTGMTPEVQARIFEPFFTTKESGHGTGLGLSTCYGIAKQNRGFIEVKSELGRGSSFRVYLPKVAEAAQAAPTTESPDELPTGDELVLVVEDDEALRELTVDALRSLGYDVVEAGDGEEAQRLLIEDAAGRIDLVLTDVGIPRLDGAALARWISAEKPDVRVLMVSGYASDKRLPIEDLGLDYRSCQSHSRASNWPPACAKPSSTAQLRRPSYSRLVGFGEIAGLLHSGRSFPEQRAMPRLVLAAAFLALLPPTLIAQTKVEIATRLIGYDLRQATGETSEVTSLPRIVVKSGSEGMVDKTSEWKYTKEFSADGKPTVTRTAHLGIRFPIYVRENNGVVRYLARVELCEREDMNNPLSAVLKTTTSFQGELLLDRPYTFEVGAPRGRRARLEILMTRH
jgi:signal transduction histidine kinase